MAEPNDGAKRGHGPVSLYVLAIGAIILSIVLLGTKFIAERGVDRQISELDQKDLVTIDERQRLPSAFTPVEDASGSWSIEADVYVPVYSSIYAGKGSLRSDLAATLSIRNTSRTEPIVVRDVHYFDTEGDLLSDFVGQPHSLGPMATADFFIDSTDLRGGTGANFIVSWAADTNVSEPVIEAVMIGSIGAKGVSFISRGKRLETIPAASVPVVE